MSWKSVSENDSEESEPLPSNQKSTAEQYSKLVPFLQEQLQLNSSSINPIIQNVSKKLSQDTEINNVTTLRQFMSVMNIHRKLSAFNPDVCVCI